MLKYIPGFRSKKKRNMIIASLYYIFSIVAAVNADATLVMPQVLIYFGFPFAVLNFIAYKKDKLYRKVSILGIVSIVIGVILIGNSMPTMVVETNKEVEKQEVAKGDLFEDLTQEKEKEAIEILKQCDINEINKITHDELLDHDGLIGYRVSTEYDNISDVCVYIDGEKLRQVRFLSKYLYQNQQVIAKATDYVMTLEEQSDYQYKCQEVVKSVLKAPSTAKFPSISNWAFSKNKEEIIIQSYVDAQNSFGAAIRSEFQFIIKDGNVTSFILDGEEYIK